MTISFTTSRFPSLSISPLMYPLARTRARWPFSSMEEEDKIFLSWSQLFENPLQYPRPANNRNAHAWVKPASAEYRQWLCRCRNMDGNRRHTFHCRHFFTEIFRFHEPNSVSRCSALSARSATILCRLPNTMHCWNTWNSSLENQGHGTLKFRDKAWAQPLSARM